MRTFQGPIILISKDFLNDDYFNLISNLVEKKLLPGSYMVILEGIHAELLRPEYVDENGSYIRFFHACEYISDRVNPDSSTGSLMNMKRTTIYRRLNEMSEKGIFIPSIKARPDIYSTADNSKASIYKLQRPNIRLLKEVEEPQKKNVKDASYRRALKVEAHLNEQLAFGFINEPLRKLGSLQLLAGYLNKLLRADETFMSNVVKSNFPIIHPESGEKGDISIEASYMVDSETMIPNDMVLVNYIYSAVQQRLLDDIENITVPIENRFRFDIVKILCDFGKEDSGGYREAIDRQLDRITGTKYRIEASRGALWLMERFGFLDENGVPYPRQDIRLLERAGDQQDESEGTVLEVLKDQRATHRFIDLRLPDFIHQQLNRALAELRLSILESDTEKGLALLPMFSRDKELLLGAEKGVAWVSNDYLSSMLARPGFKHGPVPLESFSRRMMVSLNNDKEELKFQLRFLRMLLEPQRCLYCEDIHVNSRREPRLKSLFALLGKKFLIKVINTTPGYTPKTRLSRITYDVIAVRLGAEEIEECLSRLDLIAKDKDYVEDEIFVSWGDMIINTSDVRSSKYKMGYKSKSIQSE